jgi:hypothetical protein
MVDGTDLGFYLMTVFDNSDVEPSDFATIVLVDQ